MTKCSLTREVHHSLMGGGSTPFKKEFMEIFTARSQNGFVCTELISFDQESDVTKLIVEALAVELFQHSLAVFGQELIHLALAVHLKRKYNQRLVRVWCQGQKSLKQNI